MIDIEFDIESRENIYNCEILNIFKDEIAIRYYRDSNYDNDDIDNIVVLYIQFEDIKSINRSEYDF